ncbi:nitrate reductase [Nitratireductor sp. ZSWI3]|uniref:nitrate reductase n=1 Tax=Nitratireductor sp. ZSWI3 TaxID=2966359 RepID=UPI0021502383|nr:nitrate reductase [Nitratireductor sp. ZSWI3]MCR4264623.1 molybdopterin-dependent oxidoreductase [Nitratireductor sp. ZSWI3]
MTAVQGLPETRTTCPYCGVGCGVLVGTSEARRAVVRGDPDHPANFGKLCSKGMALAETFGLDGRLLEPEIGRRKASWDEALERVAGTFAETIARHGPDSVAFYVSGQLLTEDYYVANKLMKGFIGSANIDTNSRLCMASSVAGHKRAFGEDVVPGLYADLEEADLVVLAGSNLAWCHPILHRRLMEARRRRGTRIVVIDPRRTASSSDCDLHLGLRPGSDVLLFNALLSYLAKADLLDHAFIRDHTSGIDEAVALASADAASLKDVAERCGLAPADLELFFEWFGKTRRTVTVYSQGINQSARGTDKVNAIINCHLATGRIGEPGMGPFSVTGQPNAMGGREVGGLANQLAAHMGFDDPSVERVSRFWKAPRIARGEGLKAVDMFGAVADGRIKALWIMGTNPAVSMPDAGRVRAAIRACPFVVVSDVTRTDTTRLADVLLPALGWGEKDGTVTNSERRISRQRAFLAAPGTARPDWWIISQVAQRMGFADAFGYASSAEIFREHAALSGFENDGVRLFDIGSLASLAEEAYEAMEPATWPLPAGPAIRRQRFFRDGGFATGDGRARFVPVRQEGPALLPDIDFPMVLNSGRMRDQWHTMTRTGRVPQLTANAPEPVLDIEPRDAAGMGIGEGDLVRIQSRFGFARAKARLTDTQKRGEVFLPMHWSGFFAANAAAGALSNPATDPQSGQPELKHVPVRLVREACGWEGMLLTRRDIRPSGLVHWSRSAVSGGWLYRMTGTEPADQGMLLARLLLDPRGRERMIEYTDRHGPAFRAASTDAEGRLAEVLLVAPPGALPDRDWLLALFASGEPLEPADRQGLLAGRLARAQPPVGRIICSCFGVGINQITEAVARGCTSVEAVGNATRAGTNCGSCLSEIRGIVHASRLDAAE